MNNELWFNKNPAAGGYAIERSLRFNSSDSAYLSRTPASAGNRTTWSWSGWVKQGNLSTSRQVLFGGFGALNDTDWIEFGFDTNNFYYTVNSVASKSPAIFRDVSAWQHVTVTYNGSNLKWYSNGVEVHSVSITGNLGINGNWAHTIGKSPYGPETRYFNGYLADIHFIDGQALDPTSFGEFDATTGVWNPKAYTGTYGTNGFHLDFADNSSNTATTLGKDTSGNSPANNWTPNNLSVTAGAGNDSLVDVPTNGSEVDTGSGGQVRGNYCTLNPLSNEAGALSNGNLQQAGTSTANVRCNSTIAVSSGKWYFESTLQTAESFTNIGIGTPGITTQYPGQDSVSYAYVCEQGLRVNAASTGSYGNALTSGDILMVAFDLDNNKIFFGKNGSWFGSSDPAAGTNPAYTITAGTYCPITRAYSTSAIAVLNFGQRPFAYTAPSGFKALNTANLPAPVVTKPSTVFDVALDTGANILTAAQNKLSTGTDLLWIKDRANTNNHQLIDTVRGGTATLQSNTTAAETTYSAPSGSSVAWCWDAGSSTVTNTVGSISSQVRANASAGFSVVTYSGNGSQGATFGHGLGVAPSFLIIKRRDSGASSSRWWTFHKSVTSPNANWWRNYAQLDLTLGFGDWGDDGGLAAAPSSTLITVGNYIGINTSGGTYVAYCFAPVDGYSSFGSYTGNGSTDGPFVYTGFRSRWVLVKRTSSTGDWWLYDTARNTYNVMGSILYPNISDAEFVDTSIFGKDILSNGFKVRTSNGTVNGNGSTYIYAAFAESCFALNNRAR